MEASKTFPQPVESVANPTEINHGNDVNQIVMVSSLVKELNQLKQFNKLKYYHAYPKQMEFHALSSTYNEGLLLGSNQSGKSYSGAMEMAYHLTGRYPEWWTGRKYNHPVRARAGSVTFGTTMIGIQRNLLGPPEDKSIWGSAAIPRECLVSVHTSAQVRGFVDEIIVKHISGGNSVLKLTAYSTGREAWQADTLDLVWFDEEPPEEIYSEGITRVAVGRDQKSGYCYVTFTPLKGMSKVVSKFYPVPNSSKRGYIRMGIDDALHYSAEQRTEILERYEPWERAARAYGEPVLGDGVVFSVDWDKVLCEAFEIPKHFKLLNGIDFGISHLSAAVHIAYDKESDTIYVTDCVTANNVDSATFAGMIRHMKGKWAWPHDGLQRDKHTGIALADHYRSHKLDMLPEKATHEGGKSNSLEVSVLDCLERFKSGRLKIFNNGKCVHLLKELKDYHRIEGDIVPIKDDAISAMRYAVMMKRFAEAQKDEDHFVEKWRKSQRVGRDNYMAQ